MVREALTTYWSLVSGVTDVTRQRATAAAKSLVAQGEATRTQVSGLAEEILSTSKANRAALVNLVRYEIERTLLALGLAKSDEVDRLTERVAALERQVAGLQAAAPDRTAEPAPRPAAATKAAKKVAPAKKAAAAKKTPAKKVSR